MGELKRFEKKELPFEADLRVDFIRHGRPDYELHPEGALDQEAIYWVLKEAIAFCKTLKPDEVIWFWKSPRNRAQETAIIYESVLEKNGIKIKKIKTQPLAQDASTGPMFYKKVEAARAQDPETSVGWFDFWSTLEEMPADSEGPKDVADRVLQMVQMFDALMKKNPIPSGKKLHIILFAHEEIFLNILQSTIGRKLGKGKGPTYGERMQLDFFKGQKPSDDTTVNLNYRNFDGKFAYHNDRKNPANRNIYSLPE